MSLPFGWAEGKAQANATKHGVTFEEVSTVFADPLAAIFTDEAHSDEELREIMVGHSAEDRLLGVGFTERGEADPHHQCPAGHQAPAEGL